MSDIKQETGHLISKSYNFILDYIKKGAIFILIFVIFCSNFFALSLSLQCNRSEPINIKLASGLFAFMFGFMYIIVNYYLYRIRMQNYPCILSNNKIFSF